MSMLLKLGNVFLQQNEVEKAVKVFKLFIEDCPNDFRGYFNLGKALCSLENASSTSQEEECFARYQEAICHFKKALSLNSDIVDAHVSLSALYIKIKEPQCAVLHCKTGLELEVMNSNCLFNLNIALRQLNKLPEAVNYTRSKIPSMGQVPCIDNCHFQEQSGVNVITIVLLKWGTKYGQEYVTSLTTSIRRHLNNSLNYRIVCFTDSVDASCLDEFVSYRYSNNSFLSNKQHDSHILYRLLLDFSEENWTGWWYKGFLFSEESGLCGPILYLDLDTVICSNIDFLATAVLESIQMLCIPMHNSADVDDSYSPLSTDTIFESSNSDTSKYFACLSAGGIANEGMSCFHE